MLNDYITVLGIESSCDETAVSIVRLKDKKDGEILSNIVFSQILTYALISTLSLIIELFY